MDDIYDIVYIGAGVANIAGAFFLHYRKPDIDFLLIEMGTDITYRDKGSPIDCVCGIGGCGLFSDGKFSYYNSSTDIWNLEKSKLESSYRFLKEVIMNKYREIPDFPNDDLDRFVPNENWKLKNYNSDYLNFEERKDLIFRITCEFHNENNNKFKLNTEVIDIIKQDPSQYYIIKCKDIKSNLVSEIKTKKIILGGGRFMPLFIKKISFIPTIFKRIELGIRFEGPSGSSIFNPCTNIDPKFIKYNTDQQIEYRTFCWCRNGEIVQTNFKGIETWSGRADNYNKLKSNFGFNVRFKDSKYIPILNGILNVKPFVLDINNINKLKDICGDFAYYLLEGLRSFIQFNGKSLEDDFTEFIITGPTIEGVGEYPLTDSNLRVINENIWVVGDSTGKFRGIVASMLSGIFVSHQLLEELDTIKKQ